MSADEIGVRVDDDEPAVPCPCKHIATCDKTVCNIAPVWYQTSCGELVGVTLGVLAEKLLRPRNECLLRHSGIYRCEVNFPVDCTYTPTAVRVTMRQLRKLAAEYVKYRSKLYKRLYGYNGEGGP